MFLLRKKASMWGRVTATVSDSEYEYASIAPSLPRSTGLLAIPKRAARLLCYFGRHDRALWLSWGEGETLVGEWKCQRCGPLLSEADVAGVGSV